MQIWSDGKPGQYLGEFGKHDMPKDRRVAMMEILDDEGQPFWIRIASRSFRLAKTEIRTGEREYILTQNHVCRNAVVIEDPKHDRLNYIWHVGIVDLETYERIFDLEDFIPHDDRPDPERFYGGRYAPEEKSFFWPPREPLVKHASISGSTAHATDPTLLSRLKSLAR